MIKLVNKGIVIRYGKKALLITLDKSWNAYSESQFYATNVSCEIKIYSLGLFLLVFINKRI